MAWVVVRVVRGPLGLLNPRPGVRRFARGRAVDSIRGRFVDQPDVGLSAATAPASVVDRHSCAREVRSYTICAVAELRAACVPVRLCGGSGTARDTLDIGEV